MTSIVGPKRVIHADLAFLESHSPQRAWLARWLSWQCRRDISVCNFHTDPHLSINCFRLLTTKHLLANWSSRNLSRSLNTLSFYLGPWARIGQGYGYSNSVVPSLSGREVVSVISGIYYRIRHLSGWPGCF